jgi:ribosome-interacting GTPase 1
MLCAQVVMKSSETVELTKSLTSNDTQQHHESIPQCTRQSSDKGARIQVLDLPGIIEGAAEGKGRGRQVISTARTCNLILIVLDSAKPLTHKKIIEAELFSFGIRMNQTYPNVKLIKKENGGIGYQEMVPQTKGMNSEVCRMVLKEYKISCAEVILREDITVDQFIDVIEGNRAYIPVLYVFNKIDALTIEELDILDQMPNYVPISSQHQWNLEELMEEIWNKCNMLRIYTKPKGQVSDGFVRSCLCSCYKPNSFPAA